MTRIVAALLSLAIAVAVPVILVVDGLRAITSAWYVQAVYDHGGVSSDPYGLSPRQRTRLALVGLHSILPQAGEGLQALRAARLPNGKRAFQPREVRHMADVRTLLGRAYSFQLAALAVLAALTLALTFSPSLRTLVPRSLRRGAWLTLGLAAVVALLVVADYGAFSTPFHRLFFTGSSWRFADTDMLRRLYPDRFWMDTAIVVGAVAVGQAAAFLALARLWKRRASVGQAFRARLRTHST
jgi:integral membrane protein (TIGR01906 family)